MVENDAQNGLLCKAFLQYLRKSNVSFDNNVLHRADDGFYTKFGAATLFLAGGSLNSK